MAIVVTCTNPECRQPCMVPDDLAGRLVRCPKCPALIQVPLAPGPEQLLSLRPGENFDLDLNQFDFEGQREEGDTALPPPPPRQGGGEWLKGVEAFFHSCRVSRTGMILLAVALGCLVFLLIFTFLPWNYLWHPDPARRRTWIGLITAGGAFSFFLTLLVLGFFITILALRHSFLFEFALWGVAGWGTLSTFWRLLEIILAYGTEGSTRWSAGVGLFLSLLVSLGAAGTAGFICIQRLIHANPPPTTPPPPVPPPTMPPPYPSVPAQ